MIRRPRKYKNKLYKSILNPEKLEDRRLLSCTSSNVQYATDALLRAAGLPTNVIPGFANDDHRVLITLSDGIDGSACFVKGETEYEVSGQISHGAATSTPSSSHTDSIVTLTGSSLTPEPKAEGSNAFELTSSTTSEFDFDKNVKFNNGTTLGVTIARTGAEVTVNNLIQVVIDDTAPTASLNLVRASERPRETRNSAATVMIADAGSGVAGSYEIVRIVSLEREGLAISDLSSLTFNDLTVKGLESLQSQTEEGEIATYRLTVELNNNVVDRLGNSGSKIVFEDWDVNTLRPQAPALTYSNDQGVIDPDRFVNAETDVLSTRLDNGTLSFAGTASDVERVEVVLTSDDEPPTSNPVGRVFTGEELANGTIAGTFENVSEGRYTVTRTLESSVNDSDASDTQKIVVDNTPPQFGQALTETSGTISNTSVDIEVTAEDSLSGIFEFQTFVDGVASDTSIGALGNGTHLVSAEVTDWAGNTSTQESEFVVDGIPPETSISVDGELFSGSALPVPVIGVPVFNITVEDQIYVGELDNTFTTQLIKVDANESEIPLTAPVEFNLDDLNGDTSTGFGGLIYGLYYPRNSARRS